MYSPAGYLLFSDIPKNEIFQWRPGAGESVYRKQSGYGGADAPPGFVIGSTVSRWINKGVSSSASMAIAGLPASSRMARSPCSPIAMRANG